MAIFFRNGGWAFLIDEFMFLISIIFGLATMIKPEDSYL